MLFFLSFPPSFLSSVGLADFLHDCTHCSLAIAFSSSCSPPPMFLPLDTQTHGPKTHTCYPMPLLSYLPYPLLLLLHTSGYDAHRSMVHSVLPPLLTLNSSCCSYPNPELLLNRPPTLPNP